MIPIVVNGYESKNYTDNKSVIVLPLMVEQASNYVFLLALGIDLYFLSTVTHAMTVTEFKAQPALFIEC